MEEVEDREGEVVEEEAAGGSLSSREDAPG